MAKTVQLLSKEKIPLLERWKLEALFKQYEMKNFHRDSTALFWYALGAEKSFYYLRYSSITEQDLRKELEEKFGKYTIIEMYGGGKHDI